MPRTNHDQVFRDGALQSETTSEVSDDAIEAEEADERLRLALPLARIWAQDARSQSEWNGYNTAQLRDRLATLDDRVARMARALIYLTRKHGVRG